MDPRLRGDDLEVFRRLEANFCLTLCNTFNKVTLFNSAPNESMTVEVYFQGSKKFLALESGKPRVIQPGGEELDMLIDASESLVVACNPDDKGGSIRMKSGFKITGGEPMEPNVTRLPEGGMAYIERNNEVIVKISHRPGIIR